MKKKKLVHISRVRCWSCIHLRKYMFSRGYYCVRSRFIPEFVEPYFAVKCTDYKPNEEKRKKKNEEKMVRSNS